MNATGTGGTLTMPELGVVADIREWTFEYYIPAGLPERVKSIDIGRPLIASYHMGTCRLVFPSGNAQQRRNLRRVMRAIR